MHDDSILQFYQKCISNSYISTSWVSNLLMAKGHIHYHGLVCRLHLEKITIIGIPKSLNCCHFYSIYMIYKCGRGPHRVGGS